MSFAKVASPAASAVGAEFCLSELEERLEMTAVSGAGTQAYVCCECTLYGCNNSD